MNKLDKFVRAGSLQDGEKYLCQISQSSNDNREFTTVTFIGYTACPAIVVVQNLNLGRFRCNRMDLFVQSK